MTSVSFDVIGTPAPQGSKRHVGRGIMVESSKNVRPWRDAVAAQAATHATRCLTGPITLDVVFRMRMPASRPARARTEGVTPSTRRPDLSKLVRSTEDALVDAGLIADDALIHTINARKIEVHNQWTGATITIREDTQP